MTLWERFNIPDGSELPLIIDLLLSGAFAGLGLILAWHWASERPFWLLLLVAGGTLAITAVNRWLLEDYGWPQWYEFSLLLVKFAAFLWVGVWLLRREARRLKVNSDSE